MKQPSPPGLLHARLLDGSGGARDLGRADVSHWEPTEGPLWLHLDRATPELSAWLRERSGLPEAACDALLAEETRPGSSRVGDGLLVVLRGVNLNPGADPEDMVSLRLWLEPNRILSLSKRRLLAVPDVLEELDRGTGPVDAPDTLIWLAIRLIDRLRPVLERIEDELDEYEERALSGSGGDLQNQLAALRQEVAAIRRHVAPQREAVARLAETRGRLFDEEHLDHLGNVRDQVARAVEHVEELRERASVVNDLIAGRLAEQLNRRLFMLALVTAMFLPLGLITGLLGINVGGIPGADAPHAFWAVCGVLGALGLLQAALLRRLRWW
jgi:zinc transporter